MINKSLLYSQSLFLSFCYSGFLGKTALCINDLGLSVYLLLINSKPISWFQSHLQRVRGLNENVPWKSVQGCRKAHSMSSLLIIIFPWELIFYDSMILRLHTRENEWFECTTVHGPPHTGPRISLVSGCSCLLSLPLERLWDLEVMLLPLQEAYCCVQTDAQKVTKEILF